jgi:hypothetical protein
VSKVVRLLYRHAKEMKVKTMKETVDVYLAGIEANQARAEANHEETTAKLNVHHERMKSSVNAWRKGPTACQ